MASVCDDRSWRMVHEELSAPDPRYAILLALVILWFALGLATLSFGSCFSSADNTY